MITTTRDTLWLFNPNRNIFHRNEDGRPYGCAIYKEHWEEKTIIGFTTKSYLLSDGSKIPKNSDKIRFQYSEVEDDIFVNDHSQRIQDQVKLIKDANLLRQIDALIQQTITI